MDKDKMPIEKKKTNGCLIALLVFVLLFIGLIGGGYLLYKKITTQSQQINLGVTYTQDDLNNAVDQLEANTDNTNSSIQAVKDIYLSDAQATALANDMLPTISSASLQNTQIKFSTNQVAISSLLTYQGKQYPIYVLAKVYLNDDKTVGVTIEDSKLGPISLPSNSLIQENANMLVKKATDSAKISSLTISDNSLHVVLDN